MMYTTKSQWGANSIKGTFAKQVPDTIVIHHSTTGYDGAKTIKAIQNYHLGLGWTDIGYHFLIGEDGLIFEGRPIIAQGAHVSGHNKDKIAICMVGNFEINRPPEMALEALKKLVGILSYQFDIKIISWHSNYANTLCPGKYLRTWLEKGGLNQ